MSCSSSNGKSKKKKIEFLLPPLLVHSIQAFSGLDGGHTPGGGQYVLESIDSMELLL